MMAKKFILMIVFIIPTDSRDFYIVQYVIFIILEVGYCILINKKRPYLHDKANNEAISSTLCNVICLILNLIAADSINFDHNKYTIIAVVQFFLILFTISNLLFDLLGNSSYFQLIIK